MQSTDSSLVKAGFPNTVVGSPRRKQPVSPLKTKRPANGSSHPWLPLALPAAPLLLVVEAIEDVKGYEILVFNTARLPTMF